MDNTVAVLLLLCALSSAQGEAADEKADLAEAIRTVSSDLENHKDVIEELKAENKRLADKLKELGEQIGSPTSIKKEIQSLFFLSTLNTPLSEAYPNVALRGRATQSDRFDSVYSAAGNAIDGNRDSNFSHGSCSRTKAQTDPWWRVDLLEPHIVTSIAITNELSNSERLDGAEIHIGNSLRMNANMNPLNSKETGARRILYSSPIHNQFVQALSHPGSWTWLVEVAVVPEIKAGKSQTITFTAQVVGRYVSVLLTGPNRLLTVCEVEIYGYRAPNGENLALKGKASQSSVTTYLSAFNAIDGSRNGVCSQTGSELNPWWRLDLGKTHKIFSVNVTNMVSYPERINGAEIRIGDSVENNGNNNPSCAVIQTIPPGFTYEFECHGMDGRYVNIVIPGRRTSLALCEVEVYGSVLD